MYRSCVCATIINLHNVNNIPRIIRVRLAKITTDALRECALSLEHLLCSLGPALLVAQLLERAHVLVAPGPEAISLTVHRRHIGFAREGRRFS